MSTKSNSHLAMLSRDRRRRRKIAWLQDNGPCVRCGSSENLQVDHIDPGSKLLNPGDLWNRSSQVRLAELAKCQVLCEICHKEKTRAHLKEVAKRRRGIPIEHVPAETVELACAACGIAFAKRAAKERYAAKTRTEGPFCGARCRSLAMRLRRWRLRQQSQEIKDRDTKIISLGSQRKPVGAICLEVGCAKSVVKRVLRGAGVALLQQGRRASITSKLTRPQVDKIRALSSSLTQREISLIFGVSQSNVSNIIRGKTWR